MADIRLENVKKCFGEVTIIEDLTLHIRDQELMVLVGPSGCGKSTALRMIAGLETLTAGTLSIGDRVVNKVPPKDRDVAMVFQSYALYPHMTVRQNIGFGLRIRKTPKDEMNRQINEVAKSLELTEYLDRKPKALSGGQRQRVALGRAIIRKPAVFLFDEPLSNLDAELRVTMRAEISRLQKRLKTTSVYVTHDQVEAMTMGHRIAVMKDGDLMQVGTPLDLYNHPQNLFVARFIGTPPMNIIEATVSADGSRVQAPGLDLPLAQALLSVGNAYRGREVVVGFRPESVTEQADDLPQHWVQVSATVIMVEPLGHEVIAHVDIAGNRVVAKLGPRTIPDLDEQIPLVIDSNSLFLFDKSTTKCLPAKDSQSINP